MVRLSLPPWPSVFSFASAAFLGLGTRIFRSSSFPPNPAFAFSAQRTGSFHAFMVSQAAAKMQNSSESRSSNSTRDSPQTSELLRACCYTAPMAVQVSPFVQHYEWGMPASVSLVAKFAAVARRQEKAAAAGDAWDAILMEKNVPEGLRRRASTLEFSAIQGDTRPFAELWMGVHSSGPNRVIACFNDPVLAQKSAELAAWSSSLSHPTSPRQARDEEGGNIAEEPSRRPLKRRDSSEFRLSCLSRWLGKSQARESEATNNSGAPEPPLSRRRSLAEAFIGCPLPIFIAANPDFMGGQNKLPFLFKVLSVKKPLSIQSHPDRQLAEILHRQHPQHFPDTNHKPELAIAVGPFEALCGFRAVEEIVLFILHTPELKRVLGGDDFLREAGALELLEKQKFSRHSTLRSDSSARKELCDGDVLADPRGTQTSGDTAAGVPTPGARQEDRTALLKTLFSKVMHLPRETASAALEALVTRLQTSGDLPSGTSLSDSEQEALQTANNVAVRLHAAHGLDPGVFAAFFLNYAKLKSGDAIFIGPNIPHCYLSGHALECMANSDNVIRGGLTPKHTDIDLLCSSLRFDHQGSYLRVRPEILPASEPASESTDASNSGGQGDIAVYDPHVDGLSDFKVYKLRIKAGQKLDDCGRLLGGAPGLGLVLHCPFKTLLTIRRGRERVSIPLHFGEVVFISAGSSLVLETAPSEQCLDKNMESEFPSPAAEFSEVVDSQIDQLLLEEDRDSCILYLVSFSNRTAAEARNDL
ncbi:phosphomannose isomerase type I protein [Toxoplasma gondii GAB2-2007-GAL-DOM2]|uniref:mannose-6-phosphate isomerase n=5 Tax=Toxoplasma gondii TaxID=5811 RepID=A0A3R8G8G9_TOXGO|nr:phosphomannose isomerase type I protein [Toxoplasma gondii GAB2-2007-GAL-DOM2]KFG40190.1 phosphomannose isomerase type I protein [Toxoplasma gondii p89]PUA84439.1 phosphomannose isomerase type I protein [Toxoplasma gondii TgCATBr9]RQX71261.1 phosphomannose isomerase type I protein [Toxoplasma gondii CAST]